MQQSLLRNKCDELKLQSYNFRNELHTFQKINAMYDKSGKMTFLKIAFNAQLQLFLRIQ